MLCEKGVIFGIGWCAKHAGTKQYCEKVEKSFTGYNILFCNKEKGKYLDKMINDQLLSGSCFYWCRNNNVSNIKDATCHYIKKICSSETNDSNEEEQRSVRPSSK